MAVFCKFVVFNCSGTERQHVANDYAKRLSIGVTECEVNCLSYFYNGV